MPRPRLIQEDTRVYNLVLGESVFGQLHQMASISRERQEDDQRCTTDPKLLRGT